MQCFGLMLREAGSTTTILGEKKS